MRRIRSLTRSSSTHGLRDGGRASEFFNQDKHWRIADEAHLRQWSEVFRCVRTGVYQEDKPCEDLDPYEVVENICIHRKEPRNALCHSHKPILKARMYSTKRPHRIKGASELGLKNLPRQSHHTVAPVPSPFQNCIHHHCLPRYWLNWTCPRRKSKLACSLVVYHSSG